MNKIHRTVWNAALGAWIAAPENTRASTKQKGAGRRSRLLAIGLGLGLGLVSSAGWAAGGAGGAGNFNSGGAGGDIGAAGQSTAYNPGGAAGVAPGGNGGNGGTVAQVTAGAGGGGGANGTVSAPTGGNGGNAGANLSGGGASYGGGGGGAGGNGFIAATATTNTVTVRGGNGGTGGDGRSGGGGSGGGGGGGGGDAGTALIVTTSGTTVVNAASGSLLGGNGGNGGAGNGTFTGGAVGNGGNGGNAGAGLSGTDLVVTNAGTIVGGQGGKGGSSSNSAAGTNGIGGVGISGAISVVNSGTITGGLGGNGVTRANAITFSGTNNTLELQAGSAITGNVVAVSGGINSFVLGGTGTDAFNVGGIGTLYQNFNRFSKTGSGSWALTGTTAAVTPWTVSGGTLSIASDAALGATSGALTLDGGALQTTADITTSRAVTLGAAGGTFSPNSGTALTLNDVVSGAGGLKMSGAGTLALIGTNTYTGITTISAGTLQVGNGGTTGTLGTGPVTNNAALVFNRSNDISVANAIGGSGSVTQNGTGTLALSGSNSYAGGTVIDGGTLSVASDQALGNAAGALTLNGGTLQVTGAAFNTLSRSITLGAAGGTFDVDSAFNTLALTTAIGGDGALTKTGVGALALTTANTYAGGTQVNAGALEARVSGALGAGPVAVNGGGALIFLGTADAGNLHITMAARNDPINGGYVEFKDTTSAGSATLVTATGANVTFAGHSTADTATIENHGGSTTVWFDASAGRAHITNFAGGHTDFLDNGSAGQATLVNEAGGLIDFFDVTTADQATLVNKADGAVRISRLGAAGIRIGSLEGAGRVLLGAKALTTGGLNTSTEVSGVISGVGGSVVKIGSGALTLSGDNTYTGGTALHQGRLNVGHNHALGTGVLSMDDDTTLGFSADGVTIANAVHLTGLNDPIIDTGAFHGAMSGVISGAGFITKEGTGTLTLSGANTYTGATHVANGTLQAGAADTFSAASAHSVAAGATLDLAGHNQTVAGVSNAGTVNLAGSTPGTVLTVTGPWVGNGGTLALSTALASDASVSDKLLLSGTAAVASGSTKVAITNLNGLGGQTVGKGIEIVGTENGASIDAGAFSLAAPVAAGAFEYRLNSTAGGAYLSNTLPAPEPGPGPSPDPVAPAAGAPLYRAEVPLLAALPEQLRQANLAMLGSMHQRMGDDGASAANPEQGQRQAWGRILTVDRDIQQGGTVSPSSEGRLTGFQAGTDLWATPNWRAGVYVGKLEGDMKVSGFARGIAGYAAGQNDLKNEYLGGYLTYKTDSGFYADGVLQAGRHRTAVGTSFGGPAGSNKASSLLASVEVGQAFALGAGWSIEPQLQLVHQRLNLQDTGLIGATVQQDTHNGWAVRAGLRVKGEFVTSAGTVQPYARLNVWHTSSGTDSARFIGPAAFTDILTPTGGTSTEAALGANWQVSPSTGVYGEIGQLWASGGSAKTKGGPNASLGVKVRW